MQIKYPRELTKKNYVRFQNQCLKENRSFECIRCGKEFQMGDLIFKFRGKRDYYCFNCYKELYVDISDEILDEKDKQFIDTGKWD